MSERIDTSYCVTEDGQFTDDLYSVLQEMADNDALHEGATYYEQDFKPLEGRDVLNARAVIDAGDDAMSDIAGEWYTCDLDVSDEAVKELQVLLDGWLKVHTNILRNYSKAVGRVRECKVTAEMVAEMREPASNGEGV